MSEVFEVCESNFYSNIRSVQKILGSQHISDLGITSHKQDLANASEAIAEAAQELNKMEIEYNINRNPEFKSKIDVFKDEHRQYKRNLAKAEKKLRDQQVEQQNSGPLFEQDDHNENGINPLLQAKRQMYENEAVANEVALNLKKNNETLVKNINRMGEIDNQLTMAQKLLTSIKKKLKKNKMIMCGTLIFVLLVFLAVLYSFLFGTK